MYLDVVAELSFALKQVFLYIDYAGITLYGEIAEP